MAISFHVTAADCLAVADSDGNMISLFDLRSLCAALNNNERPSDAEAAMIAAREPRGDTAIETGK